MSEPRDALSGNKVADATSFIRVLQIEPLARACMSVLDKTELPRFAPPASGGSGLKALRLISKGVNEVLMRNISGYTLILDGLHVEELPLGPSERSELPHLLRRTQLLRLTVVVMGDDVANRVDMRHIRQFQQFVAAVGPALKTVTTLELKWIDRDQQIDGNEDDHEHVMSALLVPLASICTLVQRLTVSGDVGAPLLAAFGASCKQLTSLETSNIRHGTAERLSELLPTVTSTRMRLFDPYEDHDDHSEGHMLAISTCRTLTSLDLPDHELTEQTWRALPPSLRELDVGRIRGAWGPDSIVPAGLHLPNLKKVTALGDLALGQLVNLLNAAPNLQHLEMRDVMVPRSSNQIPNLKLLHARLLAGLVCNSWHRFPEQQPEGVVIQLTDVPLPQFDADFVRRLPVFELFGKVELGTVEPLLLESLVTVFPRLRWLGISKPMQSLLLPTLAVFPLQALSLTAAWTRFSALELGTLCLRIPSLEHVTVSARLPTGSLANECQAIGNILSAWGRTVEVHAQ